MSELAKNLKYFRNKKGISQKELAYELNISQTSIAHYELGARQPSIQTLTNMSLFYNTSIDVLVGNTRNINIAPDIDENELIVRLVECLVNKNIYTFYQLTETYILNKYDFKYIVESFFEKILFKIGELWEIGLITEADEHYATNVVRKVANTINIKIKKGINTKKALLFTVNSEQHTLGLELVSDYLEILGIDSMYLGNNLQIKNIVTLVREYEPDLILMSITMEKSINDLIFNIQYILKEVNNDFAIGVGGQAVKAFRPMNQYESVFVLDDLSDVEQLVNAL